MGTAFPLRILEAVFTPQLLNPAAIPLLPVIVSNSCAPPFCRRSSNESPLSNGKGDTAKTSFFTLKETDEASLQNNTPFISYAQYAEKPDRHTDSNKLLGALRWSKLHLQTGCGAFFHNGRHRFGK